MVSGVNRRRPSACAENSRPRPFAFSRGGRWQIALFESGSCTPFSITSPGPILLVPSSLRCYDLNERSNYGDCISHPIATNAATSWFGIGATVRDPFRSPPGRDSGSCHQCFLRQRLCGRLHARSLPRYWCFAFGLVLLFRVQRGVAVPNPEAYFQHHRGSAAPAVG